MDKTNIKQASSSVSNARRKLLKLGIYSAPVILLLGKVSGARASGGKNSTGNSGKNSVSNRQGGSGEGQNNKGSIGFPLIPDF